MSHRDSAAAALAPRLAATIHDTTNALTVVLGWIERAGLTETDREQALDRAARHARWARDQLRELIGAAPTSAEVARDHASVVARRTIDDLMIEAQQAGVVLESSVTEAAATRTLPQATAAWQVLTNLLLNAIAATPRGRRVSLDVAVHDAHFVRFLVRDEGPGIPTERRATLFDDGISTRPHGAGLGLRHARALAHENGGKLVLAESSQGACFELDWPASRSCGRGLDGMRVLLLEDDEAVIELLELALTARGAQLTVVRTKEHLDRALAAQPFEVVLVDLSPLASLDPNIELNRIVELGRAQHRDVTLVAISGNVTNAPAPDLLWVRKPFAPGELADAIVHARAMR